MAQIITKRDVESYGQVIQKICEKNDLIPIIMDRTETILTIKDRKRKKSDVKGLYVRPNLVLADIGFKDDRADIGAFVYMIPIAFIKKDKVSDAVLKIYNGEIDGVTAGKEIPTF